MKVFVWRNDWDPDHSTMVGFGETVEDARKAVLIEIGRISSGSRDPRYLNQLGELCLDVRRKPDEVLEAYAYLVARVES